MYKFFWAAVLMVFAMAAYAAEPATVIPVNVGVSVLYDASPSDVVGGVDVSAVKITDNYDFKQNRLRTYEDNGLVDYSQTETMGYQSPSTLPHCQQNMELQVVVPLASYDQVSLFR